VTEEAVFRVLLVEDDAADQLLLQEAAELSGVAHTLHTARNGAEALELLSTVEDSWPQLVLLDLNMPRMNGYELLCQLRNSPNPALRTLPVVMMTNSNANDDVSRCYAAGASAYVCKSMDLESFFGTVKTTLAYWQQVALSPHTDGTPRRA
jgi:CheY-like chemotaxis protein